MSSIHEEKPASLPMFLEIVEKFQTDAEESLWYRGCGRESYTLLPSMYRHRKAKNATELAELERKLMTRFRQRSIPYHTRSLEDDWNTLFFVDG